MRFIVALLLTALLAFVAGLYLPWWSPVLVAFAVGLIVHQQAGKAFLAGFMALFLLWGCIAWWIDSRNESILSSRIAGLLGLGNSSMLLVLITALTGGLLAGFAAMSGSYLRSAKQG